VVELGGLVLLGGLGGYGDGVAVGLDADGLNGNLCELWDSDGFLVGLNRT
jgi:hypothetical protein